MNPERPTAAPDLWLVTLAEGARLLEAGEAEAAARVLDGLMVLCAPSAPRPSPQVAKQAHELLQCCYQAEAKLRQSIVRDLSQLACGQRAQAYRAR